MSLKDRVALHLPFLRRYARALTGSQEHGDAIVRRALEALVSGDAQLNEGLPSRAALYRLLHVASPDPAISSPMRPSASPAASPEERLRRLPAAPRQALLLHALEGFSFHDIGAILDVSPAEAERMARDAQAEIEHDLVTDVLIIEDEAMIALDIKEIAEELGHRVAGIARTRDDAVRAARRRPPGLVLADILLADESSGVDAVRRILEDFDAPVIFVTAYPERLLSGDRVEPAYLLTKPFDRGALKAMIGQALFFHRPNASAA